MNDSAAINIDIDGVVRKSHRVWQFNDFFIRDFVNQGKSLTSVTYTKLIERDLFRMCFYSLCVRMIFP